MIEQTDVLFFSQVDAQDVQEERDQQRDRKSSLPFLVSGPDFPLAVAKQGPLLCLQSSHGNLSAVVPKTDLIMNPRRWRIPGDRLDRFADKGKSRGV